MDQEPVDKLAMDRPAPQIVDYATPAKRTSDFTILRRVFNVGLTLVSLIAIALAPILLGLLAIILAALLGRGC